MLASQQQTPPAPPNEIIIYDAIGPQGEASFQKIQAQLNAMAGATEIVLRINSPGGDLLESIAIFNALKKHPVSAVIGGVAAGAASIVAMAASEITIDPQAFIHLCDPRTVIITVDPQDMDESAAHLEKLANLMADIYSGRTGLSKERIRKMMADDAWLYAQEALQLGFVDKILEA